MIETYQKIKKLDATLRAQKFFSFFHISGGGLPGIKTFHPIRIYYYKHMKRYGLVGCGAIMECADVLAVIESLNYLASTMQR